MSMWYYFDGKDKKGPVDEATLIDVIKGGVINVSTMVWKNGFPDWLEAGKVDELKNYFLQIEPPPITAPPQSYTASAPNNNAQPYENTIDGVKSVLDVAVDVGDKHLKNGLKAASRYVTSPADCPPQYLFASILIAILIAIISSWMASWEGFVSSVIPIAMSLRVRRQFIAGNVEAAKKLSKMTKRCLWLLPILIILGWLMQGVIGEILRSSSQTMR